MGRWLRRLTPALPLAAWALAIGGTGRWPGGDGPHVLGTAMRLAQLLRAGELGDLWRGLDTLVGPHPPGAYLPATLTYVGVGPTTGGAHLVAGALVLWVLWDGVRRLGGGPVGALVLLACPLVWLQAESYGADLLAAAAVAQAVSWLAASQGLARRGPTLAFGLWMGLAFLTKYTSPLFLVGPCLVAGWSIARRGRWLALAQAVGVFLLSAGVWFAAHWRAVTGYLGASTDTGNAVLTNRDLLTGPWWAPERLGWYPATVVDGLGWPGVLAVGLGVLVVARRPRAPWRAWALPLAGALGGLLLLNLQSQRQDRYLLPAIPLLAAVVGSSRARWFAAPPLAVGAYGVAATFLLSVDVPGTRDYRHTWAEAGADWPWVDEAYRPVSLDPSPWRLDHGIARLRHHHGSDTGTVAFLLDERDGAPSFGVTLSRVAAAGLRWHVATVMVMDRAGPPEAAVFVGPFAAEGWPSRDFTALLAIVDPTDHRRERWLRHSQMTLEESWSLPGGREGRIYTWSGEGRIPGTPRPLPPLGD